ncbi:hypothetical protein [Pseudomonas fluorescens]|uniref:hypothetical protein n=1 Tax=Pseudomonas fluorescens TaxID=294 RepID=UPI0028594B77|nr:hypothetical protein [Pseudomonas fluorescens]MDR6163532.1 hypothetical protein [Pseudomonas fluorescens]
MTNNPTIDGVSREFLERIRQYLIDIGEIGEFGAELFQLLNVDAPAVERQPIKNASEVAYNLQAENARLEARITQLESETRFAAATHQAARDRIAELESGRGEMIRLLREVVETGALLFDSQPDFETLEADICACLDATAALNGPAK